MKGEKEEGLNERDQGRLEWDDGRGAKRSGTLSFLQFFSEKPSKCKWVKLEYSYKKVPISVESI